MLWKIDESKFGMVCGNCILKPKIRGVFFFGNPLNGNVGTNTHHIASAIGIMIFVV